MSEGLCPHCQAVIPANTDGRCSSCGRLLDAPPLHLDMSVQRRKTSRIGQSLFILALLVGAVLVVEAVLRLVRGDVLSAFYNSLGLLVVLWGVTRNEHLRSVPTEKPRGKLGLTRLAIYVAMGVGIYLGLRIWVAQSELAAIVGTSIPGQYQNEYFGFQLPYDSSWQDVTESNQKKVPATTAVNPSLLLALALPPTEADATAASVLLTAVKIPDAEAELTSSEHLDHMVSKLLERADRPHDVKTERQTELAGMRFDRLSLTRPWGDQEIGMTFWATRRRGYLLLITGAYSTRQGLLAIEELLTKMAAADCQ